MLVLRGANPPLSVPFILLCFPKDGWVVLLLCLFVHYYIGGIGPLVEFMECSVLDHAGQGHEGTGISLLCYFLILVCHQ